MFVFLSLILLHQHARIIRSTTDIVLPLASSVATLEDRRSLLEEQIDVAEVHAAVRNGSLEEVLHAYVLPEGTEVHRIVALFDLLQEYLKTEGVLRRFDPLDLRTPMSISLEDREVKGDKYDVVTIPLHISADISEPGLELVLEFLDIAGILTVGDALLPKERDLLIRRTEVENRAGIVAVEQFFATDLLQYAQNARSYEEQLLRSFTTPAFDAAFQSILQNSLLSAAKDLLGGPFGRLLSEQKLWPMRFMETEHMSVSPARDDGVHIEAVIRIYARP
ncbi:hypothetical protein A2635_01020 [Candidatus Peribacteria bacterium RIFCSPHIGHO2_01_FULL_51_9]|nr:MAG: hypothetical protein A2635_01020 [Candidatus Peribacteria bacterium RIFCSPHIGHO2_01_FULL_51_9]